MPSLRHQNNLFYCGANMGLALKALFLLLARAISLYKSPSMSKGETPFLSQRKAVSLPAKRRFSESNASGWYNMGLRLALDDITSRPQRAYVSCHTTLRLVVSLLLLMVVGVSVSGVKAAFTEGLYCFKSNQNNTYYLCPSIGCYYENNVDQPHLTTFKTGGDQNSIWKIVPVENETDTYYLIHYKTGRYLKSNENFTTIEKGITKNNRKAVHLEVKPETLTDDFKFLIKNTSSPYQIYPKSYYTDASSMSFNPTNGHKDCYAPANGEAQGMIGMYDKTDAASKWQIPAVASASIPCATPIIKYDSGNITISYPYDNEAGITIYYTTDGTDPSTSGTKSSYSAPISSSGVIKVRAIATKTGLVKSDEAVLWGSARPFLIQSKDCADYYLAPSGNGTNVCTTSIPGAGMQWTLQDAGTSIGGVPYYYLVNNNSKKIKYNPSNYALSLNGTSADENKFCIIENGYNTGNFFLIPVSQANRVIYKVNGNVASDHCKAESNKLWGTNWDQWIFRVCNYGADQKNLFSAPPFNVSTDELMHYYHIASVGATGYYIVPPTDADGYACASNNSSDYTDNPWIFKVAVSDNWQTYYYVINAASGKYMYFNPNNNLTESQENVISMKDESDKNEGNEEKFQFVMVRSTTADACYIVPKGYSYADASHKNFYENKYFGLWFDDNNPASLKTIWSRSSTANHVKWTFEPATFAGAWADPVVSYDSDGHITISNGEEGSAFYYTTGGNTIPTTGSNLYNASEKLTVSNGITTIKVRAIASGKIPSNVITKTIVYNPTISLTASSATYTGVAQNPVSSVDVVDANNIHIASSEYEVKYVKEGTTTELTTCKDAGTYTVLLKDVDGGDYVVYGCSSYTITPKSLGDNDISVAVGKSGDNYTVTVTDGSLPALTEGTDYELSGTPNESGYVVTVIAKDGGNYSGSVQAVYAAVNFPTTTSDTDGGTAAAYQASADLTTPSDLTAYIVTDINLRTGTVNIKPVDYIPEGEAVLLLSNNDFAQTADFTTTLLSGVTSEQRTEDTNGNKLNRAVGTETVDWGQYYIFSKGEFVLSMGGKTMKAGKFYLENEAYSSGGSSQAPQILHIVRDETTKIDEIMSHSQFPNDWYTIGGQKLVKTPTVKGIYIQNGHKVVIK